MPNRRIAGAPFVLSLACVAVALVACGGGSGSDGSLFGDPGSDAGPDPNFDAAPLAQNQPDAGPASTGPCAPTELSPSFQPTWHPPNAFKANACTAQQISDFYDACLTPPIDTQKCTDYVGANGPCTSCLQSDETDAKYGPVIWHSHRAYFTLNTAGCIANEQQDLSAQSCGAAYQAILECKETVCTQCFADPNSSFSRFSSCEQQAAPTCGVYADAMHNTCGDEIHDANDPASICLPPTTTPAKTVYGTIAPIFCGK